MKLFLELFIHKILNKLLSFSSRNRVYIQFDFKIIKLTCLKLISSNPWISNAMKGMLSLANSFILVLFRYFWTLKTLSESSLSSVNLSRKSLKSEAFSTFFFLPAKARPICLDLMTYFVLAHPVLEGAAVILKLLFNHQSTYTHVHNL